MAKTKVPGSYIANEAITSAHLHSSHGITTNNIGEHANNKYFTDARARAALSAGTGITISGAGAIATTITQYTTALARATISVTDSGGDGSLAYNSTTGVMTYTGPNAAETRAHLSAGTGVGFSGGAISIGQAVATSSNVSFGTISGTVITGSTSIKTPLIEYTDGDDAITIADGGHITTGGNLIVSGNLTVQGSQTTISTATLDVADKNITLNKGAGDTSGAADGAGITIQDAVNASTDATLLWNAAGDKFVTSHALDVTGALTSTTINTGQGATEVYLMNQNVRTSDAVNFASYQVGGTSVLFADRTISNVTAIGITNTASNSYGFMEMTGTSGAYIDLKNSSSEDYDMRFISSGTGGEIISGSGDIVIKRQGATKLSTSAAGITVTGALTTTTGATFGSATRVNGDFSVSAASGEDRLAILPQSAGSGTIFMSGNEALSGYEPLTMDFETLALRTSGTPRLSIAASGATTFAGNVTTTAEITGGLFKVGNTTVLDGSRNLTNIGTIGSGNITTPTIYLNDTNTRLHEGSGNALRITTATGYIDIGSMNSGYIHFQGNKPYYFNQVLLMDANLTPYNTSGARNLGGTSNVWNHVYAKGYFIDSTEVIDASRNLTNIGTIGSGAITSTGNVQHTGLTMTSGTDIDQLYSATVSLTLSDAWQDTGIDSTDLATGTYIVQVYTDDYGVGGQHYAERYSGVMSWIGGSTNDTHTDEIALHRAGHAANNGYIYLQTKRRSSSTLMLQIRGALSNTGASNYIFKFRRMI